MIFVKKPCVFHKRTQVSGVTIFKNKEKCKAQLQLLLINFWTFSKLIV